ncbi:hypothetical protein Tco_0232997 [Tanacetum coccineum]
MVGSLMYLTASRPILVFVVCMCCLVGYQLSLQKHLESIKRVFSVPKRKPLTLGLGIQKKAMSTNRLCRCGHALICQDSRRSTSGSAQFLGDRLVSWSSKKQRSCRNQISLSLHY